MGVAVHLLPVTGQPLPLVSMGGTSIWFTSLSIGILLSVSKEIETNNTETEPVAS
jgi:cell division protein FtsW